MMMMMMMMKPPTLVGHVWIYAAASSLLSSFSCDEFFQAITHRYRYIKTYMMCLLFMIYLDAYSHIVRIVKFEEEEEKKKREKKRYIAK
jgi:hypothetical protein